MSLILETGGGTALANAYCNAAFVTSYLTDRGRETENTWSTLGASEQEAAIIKATEYIDLRFGTQFGGTRKRDLVGAKAVAHLELTGQPTAGELVTIAGITYTFQVSLGLAANEVLIGADFDTSLANLLAAMTDETGAGTKYSTVNRPLASVDLELDTDDPSILDLTAQTEGEAGNAIQFTTDIVNATLTAFYGGEDKGPQPLEFPRENLYDRAGIVVTGVPLRLRKATAEYAVRAAGAALLTDPGAAGPNSTGAIERSKKKVGPIETDITYASTGTAGNVGAGGGIVSDANITQYPAADLLLREYIKAGGIFSAVGRA